MDELEFYKDAAKQIRWRYRSAGNHKILAEGGEGYGRLADAMRSAYRVINLEDPSRHALLAAATESIGANRVDGSGIKVVFTGV